MLSKFIPSFIRTVLTGFIRVTVGWQECDPTQQQPPQRFTTAHGGSNEYPKPQASAGSLTAVGRVEHPICEHASEEPMKK